MRRFRGIVNSAVDRLRNKGDPLDALKRKISAHAIKERWRFDQLQYAEDYIDQMRSHGINAAITVGLDAAHARLIKESFALED